MISLILQQYMSLFRRHMYVKLTYQPIKKQCFPVVQTKPMDPSLIIKETSVSYPLSLSFFCPNRQSMRQEKKKKKILDSG